MAAQMTARPPRLTKLAGIGFNAFWVQGPWWLIKSVAITPGVPTAPVGPFVHRRDVRAELDRHSDACMRLMLAEGAWEQKGRAA